MYKTKVKEIDTLLKENINNDNEFRKLLKSKAEKEIEDIDSVLKKYEDKVLFELRRDLT